MKLLEGRAIFEANELATKECWFKTKRNKNFKILGKNRANLQFSNSKNEEGCKVHNNLSLLT